MSTAMEAMYQEVILDHAKHPEGRGLVAPIPGNATGESHQVNPTCGDEVTLRVEVTGDGADGIIARVSWEGQGCSISQASTSVLTGLVTGQSLTVVGQMSDAFSDLMASRGKGLDDDACEDLLGDAAAFTGVSRYPARIKCALLGWAALRDALVRSGVTPLNLHNKG